MLRGPELLERRLVLANASIVVDGSGVLTFNGSTTGSGDDSVTVSNDATAGVYTFQDTSGNIDATSANGSVAVSGSGTAIVRVTYAANSLKSLVVAGGSGSDQFAIKSTSLATTITEAGPAGASPDAITIGDSAAGVGLSGITGDVTVADANGGGSLTIDDHSDTVGRTATLSVDSTSGLGQVAGLAPRPIAYQAADFASVTVSGGSGGNAFSVLGTSTTATTTVLGGTGIDSATISGTAGQFVYDGVSSVGSGGTADSVTVVGAATSAIRGPVLIENPGGGLVATIDDSGDASNRSATVSDDPTAGLATVAGLTGAPVTVAAGASTILAIRAGTGTEVVNVLSTGPGTTAVYEGTGSTTVNVSATTGSLEILGQGGADAVNLGATDATGNLDGFAGSVYVNDSAQTTALTLRDQGSKASKSIRLAAGDAGAGVASSITGLSASLIGFRPGSVASLTIDLGSGGDSVLQSSSVAPATTIASKATDTFEVAASSAGSTLAINGTAAADRVIIGAGEVVAPIQGPISVSNTVDSTFLVVDDLRQSGSATINATLSAAGGVSTLSNFAPAPISYTTNGVDTLTIGGGTNPDHLSVDFAGADPIPPGGLVFDANNTSGAGVADSLTLTGGAFSGETLTDGVGGEGVVFLDGSKVTFTRLSSPGDSGTLVDLADVSNSSYAFNGQVTAVLLSDGPSVGGAQTGQVNLVGDQVVYQYANKAKQTIALPATMIPPATITVNMVKTPAMLRNLEIDGSGVSEVVAVDDAPSLIGLDVRPAGGDDTAQFTFAGLIRDAVSPTYDGGDGSDTLVVDAGGDSVSVLAARDPALPGVVPAGYGAVVDGARFIADRNVESIRLSNVAIGPVATSSVPAITPVAGIATPSDLVAKFTSTALGATAGQFAATIDWGDGTTSTGTVAADPSGTAGLFDVDGAHTYATAGTFTIRVSVAQPTTPVASTVGGVSVATTYIGAAGTFAATSSANVSAPTLAPIPKTIAEGPGSNAPVVVGQFTDPGGPGATYSAMIDWGDGSKTAATSVTPTAVGGSTFSVVGQHPYAATGVYFVVVSVTSSRGSTATINTTAVVTTTLDATGVAIDAHPGIAITATVATFTNPVSGDSSFTGTINWGDGTSPIPAQFVAGTAGPTGTPYSIRGTHTYATAGTFSVQTNFRSTNGDTGAATAPAVVSALAPIAATATPLTGLATRPINAAVATFVDPGGVVVTYSATIDYGDSTTGPGTIVAGPSGGDGPPVMTVSGGHTYAAAGTYAVKTTITSSDGRSAVVTGAATIASDQVVLTATDFVAARGVASTPMVATFLDPVPGETPSSAAIDFGDGSAPAVGTITMTSTTSAGTTYAISAPHTYATAGLVTFGVTVTTSAGRTASTTGLAYSSPARATLTTHAVAAPAGRAATLDLGTFVDLGGAQAASAYTVGIYWGDGQPAGPGSLTPTATPGRFEVTGMHTFLTGGVKSATAFVLSPGTSLAASRFAAGVQGYRVVPSPISAVQGVPIVDALVATTYPPGPTLGSIGAAAAPPAGVVALINWGDGTTTLGVINAAGQIAGNHTYAASGTFGLSVSLAAAGQLPATPDAAETVAVAPFVAPIAGALAPSSDSGVSNSDDVTNVNRPTFLGTGQPGATVTILAYRVDAPQTTLTLGQATIGQSGAWSVASTILADGSYQVFAEQSNTTASAPQYAALIPASAGSLVIDTVGPRITGLTIDRTNGRIDATFVDDRSGMDQSSILAASNYTIRRVSPAGATIPVGGLGVSSVSDAPTAAQGVEATINAGRPLPTGQQFALTVASGGVEDSAGNALDGEFGGFFPSGDGRPGGAFAAKFVANRVVVLSPSVRAARVVVAGPRAIVAHRLGGRGHRA